jgi:hypothetical protein
MILGNTTGRTPSLSPSSRRSARTDCYRATLDHTERGTMKFRLHLVEERSIRMCGGPEADPNCAAGKTSSPRVRSRSRQDRTEPGSRALEGLPRRKCRRPYGGTQHNLRSRFGCLRVGSRSPQGLRGRAGTDDGDDEGKSTGHGGLHLFYRHLKTEGIDTNTTKGSKS